MSDNARQTLLDEARTQAQACAETLLLNNPNEHELSQRITRFSTVLIMSVSTDLEYDFPDGTVNDVIATVKAVVREHVAQGKSVMDYATATLYFQALSGVVEKGRNKFLGAGISYEESARRIRDHCRTVLGQLSEQNIRADEEQLQIATIMVATRLGAGHDHTGETLEHFLNGLFLAKCVNELKQRIKQHLIPSTITSAEIEDVAQDIFQNESFIALREACFQSKDISSELVNSVLKRKIDDYLAGRWQV